MPWFKIDDQFDGNRKVGRCLRSDPEKRRDASAIGLWALAGPWASRNLTDGFVPAEQLEDWDDNGLQLAARLVGAGLWIEATVDGEIGYQFVNWEEYQPTKAEVEAKREPKAAAGQMGNHVRWHVNEGRVDPDCPLCDIAPAIAEGSQPVIRVGSPRPDPTRPDPTHGIDGLDRFGEFWDTYDKKVGRKGAEQKWRIALRKPGVTADLLITAAAAYITYQRANGSHPQYTKNPTTWLNGECWNDERVVRAPGQSRAAQWLHLAEDTSQIGPTS